MTILRPDQLLDEADFFVGHSGGQQIYLRRAVSSAYYAIFHTVTAAVADQFVGSSYRRTPAWTLAYRTLSHTRLREVCDAASKSTPPRKFQFLLGSGFAADLRTFATVVIEAQQNRYDADYNPLRYFKVSDGRNIISSARYACSRFKAASPDERFTFLCLLIFHARASD